MDRSVTQPEPGTLRFERLLPATVETVWAWLVEPDKRRLWFADGPMELRVGGAVDLVFDHDNLSSRDVPYPSDYAQWKGVASQERIVDLDAPRRLAFTWSGGKDGIATFELFAEGDATRLVLTHSGLADPATRIGTGGGWQSHLAVLEARLAGRDVPDFWALHAEAQKEIERLVT